jgi:tetratricopeptide (TPR) repeat protein
MTDLRIEPLTLSGAVIGDENPLPFFRDEQTSKAFNALDSIPSEFLELAGWQTGYRVLPYRIQNQYTRKRQPLTFSTVVLENDVLKATFLPAMGGRLLSLYNKIQDRELLYRNPVFQPANLAIRNAWFSGGIEWNFGQYGHALTTCSPVFAAEIRDAQGNPGLRLYDYERCKGFFWQIDFYLPPSSPFLLAYYRVINPSPEDRSMYFWTNVAVVESQDVRVLAPVQKVIYVDFTREKQSYGVGNMPLLETTNGKDASYATNYDFASEYFYQCDDVKMPWEAAVNGKGEGFFEASTSRLKYRKMFCWGMHSGGRHWQEFLSVPGSSYLEIQSGLTRTQLHGIKIPGQTQWDWTQAFGTFSGDARSIHQSDYASACAYADGVIKSQLPASELYLIEERLRQQADSAVKRVLLPGSGWGALEKRRMEKAGQNSSLPAGFEFPESTLGEGQLKWLELMEHGILTESDATDLPGEWMVQDDWQKILESSSKKHWYALLHLGVMRMEHFDVQGAVAAWQESMRLQPSAWAARNLAVAARRAGEEQKALDYYRQAWQLAQQNTELTAALAEECLDIFVHTRHFEEGMALYRALPIRIQQSDRIQILYGRIALESGLLDEVESVLRREFAVVKEGENELTDLWTEMWMKREAAKTGAAIDDNLRQRVLANYPPPTNIDFRMFIKR